MELMKKDIIVENQSKNTLQNMKFSKQKIDEDNKEGRIIFSTTNYHVFRAGCIATSQSILMEGIGAKTKSYFGINAFIREFIATLYSEKKKHIAVIFCITIFVALMLLLLYLNNNI